MDIISELPDELLIKILLFLPTRVAVSTSLLSKRWKFLWMSLPKLEFECDEDNFSISEGERLRCFLERNLALHRAPVLESLCLKLSDSHFKPEEIKFLVVIAVSHIIRELEISYFSHSSNRGVLPSCLYACKSLVILKLSGREGIGNILLDVPRVGCLASLKTLQLQDVRYANKESFQRLLSICPVLKHLSVDRCADDNMGKFTVKMPSLESLEIYIPYSFHLDGYVIDTPSLKHFKLEDYNYESHYCLIENMPKLRKACVDVVFPDIQSLIGSIVAVKRLTICSAAMYGDGFVFNQLEHLTLCLCIEDLLNRIVRVLKDSPNLRVLNLSIFDNCGSPYNTDCWNQPSNVPECLLSSLQTFKWSGYEGKPEQRDFVVYILKNARHLKMATISSQEYEVPKLQMIRELSLSSRASTVCQLAFD